MTLPATGFAPSGPTTEATVERVVDGDTIVVDADGVELYVRYLGMDAPEAVKLDTPVQFMAPEATQANAQLVSGQTSSSSATCPSRTTPARLLRHVWVDRDGTLFLVGLELVKAGFARATPLPPDTKYDALYADAEAPGQGRRPGHLGRPAQPGAGGQRRTDDTDPVAPDVHQPGARPGHRGSKPVPWRASGSTTGPPVTFSSSKVTMGWDVSSTTRSGCRARLDAPGTGHRARRPARQDLDGRSRKRGSGTVTVPAGATNVTVTSTCGDWLISLREAS